MPKEKLDGRRHNDPSGARAVQMRNAAERLAADEKARAKAVRVVQAGLRSGAITAEEVLAVEK